MRSSPSITLWITALLLIVHRSLAQSSREHIYNPGVAGAIVNIPISEPALSPFIEDFNSALVLPISGTFELSNSEFSLYNPLAFIIYRKDPGTLLSHLLCNSFGIKGLPPSEVSRVLSENLAEGADFRFASDYTVVQYAQRRRRAELFRGIGFRLQSKAESNLHIPGDVFKLIFSQNEGLQKGNSLSLNSFDARFTIETDLTCSYGSEIPKTISILNRECKLAWGVSGTYKMGHMMFQLDTEKGEITYNDDNTLSIDVLAKVSTAGVRLTNSNQYQSDPGGGGIINGHGAEFSTGFALFSSRLVALFSLNRLGFMSWNSSSESQELSFCDDSLYLTDIQNGSAAESFESGKGNSNERITFKTDSYALLKCSYISEKVDSSNLVMTNLSRARSVSVGYIQPFFRNSQEKRTPLFFISFENESLKGRVPIRVGWDYQNSHNYSSFAEFQQVGNSLTLSLWYRAQCDPLFRPVKGGEVGFRTHVYW
jgi:hypothetical protein